MGRKVSATSMVRCVAKNSTLVQCHGIVGGEVFIMAESNSPAETLAQIDKVLNATAAALRTWLNSEPVAAFVAELREGEKRLQCWVRDNQEFIERAVYNYNLMLERSRPY